LRGWRTSYKPEPEGSLARIAAARILSGGAPSLPPDPRDRALAIRLSREVVVWEARLDAALRRCSSRQLAHLEPEVLTALRIGAVQLLVLGMPAHAAVSTSTSCVAGLASRGYVNAVLRNLARTGEDPDAAAWVRLSHPEALFDRWVSKYGQEGAERLMAWNNEVPPVGGFSPVVRAFGKPGRHLPGYAIIERAGQLSAEAIPEGVYIQDEAAAVVAEGAALIPGARVVEIGAAPGGKTAHLDSRAEVVVSIELSGKRFEQWLENSSRLKWSSSFPVVADGAFLPVSECDKVVIDAPCTSTGVLRRRPDARWRWSPARLDVCVALQRRLLAEAARTVGVGGAIVFSVCSLEPEEGIGQAAWFESSTPGFRRIGFPAPAVLVREGMLDIFPPEHGIDGHFAVAWIRER
jgi:16S rRNA (cytosine967-C5)-methyltransferase